MKYNIKSEVYKEGLPFNKWFHYECNKNNRIKDLIESLGISKDRVGLVIVNDYPKPNTYILENKDSIRIIGRIFSEYL
jgi:sulfur carrier protein ThiS